MKWQIRLGVGGKKRQGGGLEIWWQRRGWNSHVGEWMGCTDAMGWSSSPRDHPQDLYTWHWLSLNLPTSPLPDIRPQGSLPHFHLVKCHFRREVFPHYFMWKNISYYDIPHSLPAYHASLLLLALTILWHLNHQLMCLLSLFSNESKASQDSRGLMFWSLLWPSVQNHACL